METNVTKRISYLPLFSFLKIKEHIFKSITTAPSKYKDIVGLRVPGKTIYIVHNPEIVQHVLVRNMKNYEKDRGYKILALLMGNGLITNTNHESWRKQRTLLQPPFHKERLQRMCEITVESTEKLLEEWKYKRGETINFTREMARLTIEIVSKTLFTSDVSSQQIQMVWDNLNYLNEMASDLVSNPLALPFWVPLPSYNKARKCIRNLDELIYGVINRRRAMENPPKDLLQLLIDSKYDDGSAMSDLQLRDEIMTVFVAGHETTVNALSWIWYLLKKNPEAELKLKKESAPFKNINPGFSDIPELRYGYGVMNEGMRIFPPVPIIGRAVVKTEDVSGYTLKSGSLVMINIAGLHRHPDFWEQPLEFKPERFLNFEMKGDNRFLFMPFGGGPHICIGNNFAMMEMQLINAILASRVEMELMSPEIEPETLITLKPGDGLMMRVSVLG